MKKNSPGPTMHVHIYLHALVATGRNFLRTLLPSQQAQSFRLLYSWYSNRWTRHVNQSCDITTPPSCSTYHKADIGAKKIL